MVSHNGILFKFSMCGHHALELTNSKADVTVIVNRAISEDGDSARVLQ